MKKQCEAYFLDSSLQCGLEKDHSSKHELEVDVMKRQLKHLVDAATKMAKQHHDTCAFSLSTKYECSCGREEVLEALKDIIQFEE